MRKMLLALIVALASSTANADPTPLPGGPFAGSPIDAKTYLLDKTVEFSVARSLPYSFPYWVAFENVIADNERLLVLMGWKSGKGAKFEPVAIRRLNTVIIPRLQSGTTITINGDAGDWASISTPAVTDPQGDDGQYSTVPGTDIASVTLARDDDYLYGLFRTHDGGPTDNTMYIVELMQYFLQLHTPGDVLINCSNPVPPGNGWGCHLGDRSGAMRAQYPPGSGAVAVGAGLVEWRIPISDLKNLPSTPSAMFPVSGMRDRGIDNRFIRVYIHPMNGQVSDELPWFDRPLIINFWN
jgi:hypothetical protein